MCMILCLVRAQSLLYQIVDLMDTILGRDAKMNPAPCHFTKALPTLLPFPIICRPATVVAISFMMRKRQMLITCLTFCHACIAVSLFPLELMKDLFLCSNFIADNCMLWNCSHQLIYQCKLIGLTFSPQSFNLFLHQCHHCNSKQRAACLLLNSVMGCQLMHQMWRISRSCDQQHWQTVVGVSFQQVTPPLNFQVKRSLSHQVPHRLVFRSAGPLPTALLMVTTKLRALWRACLGLLSRMLVRALAAVAAAVVVATPAAWVWALLLWQLLPTSRRNNQLYTKSTQLDIQSRGVVGFHRSSALEVIGTEEGSTVEIRIRGQTRTLPLPRWNKFMCPSLLLVCPLQRFENLIHGRMSENCLVPFGGWVSIGWWEGMHMQGGL